MNSIFIKIYFIFATLFSLWLYRYSINLYSYLVMIFVTDAFLMMIPFIIEGVEQALWVDKIKRLFIVIVIIFFISLGFLYNFVSGLDERFCYNFLARNIITRQVDNYCNFPPWYAKILKRTNLTRNLPSKLPNYAGFQGVDKIK